MEQRPHKPRAYIIIIIRNVFLMLLILSPVFLYIGYTHGWQSFQDQRKYPYVYWNSLDPHTDVYIAWETVESVETILALGTNPDDFPLFYTSEEKSNMHLVQLSELTANTIYYYQASYRDSNGNLQNFGPLSRFKTAPLSGAFNFTMIADTQQFFGTGHYRRVAAVFGQNSFDSDFLTYVGDVGQDSDDQQTWNLFFKETNKFSQKIPLVPLPGNHDLNNEEIMFEKYFKDSTNSEQFYYSFNYSNVQFICADISSSGSVHLDQEEHQAQYMWLNATLKASQSQDFRVLMFHRNFYVSTDINRAFQVFIDRMIDDYNISLIVHGHTHHYERLFYRNTTILCVGTGGGFLDIAFAELPESRRIQTLPSYTQVLVDGDTMEIVTYSVRNEILDYFLIQKEGESFLQVEVPF